MNFVSSIHIHELYHLKNLKIEFDPEKTPHLLVTGRNGSGKTVLLSELRDILSIALNPIQWAKEDEAGLNDKWVERSLSADYKNEELQYNSLKHIYTTILGRYEKRISVNIDMPHLYLKHSKGDFIFAYYPARRTPNFEEPKSPTRPNIESKAVLGERATSQFLNFLSDLKIQGALAQHEERNDDANQIRAWFFDFQGILRSIFQDDKLELEFDYRNYAFHIVSEGKRFKFTELSDGFAAILDIVADLILKMQREGESVSQSFLKEGIVLIDEVETHLHLSLQKEVMPFLTTLFPNIQFIVTTHSPFVLNSLDNAVAYDLEHQEVVSDLNEYSAESITAGYFDVRSASAYSEMQLQRLEGLLQTKNPLTSRDAEELERIKQQFEDLPELLAPALKGRYQELIIKYHK